VTLPARGKWPEAAFAEIELEEVRVGWLGLVREKEMAGFGYPVAFRVMQIVLRSERTSPIY
jgi:hypothetical protein